MATKVFSVAYDSYWSAVTIVNGYYPNSSSVYIFGLLFASIAMKRAGFSISNMVSTNIFYFWINLARSSCFSTSLLALSTSFFLRRKFLQFLKQWPYVFICFISSESLRSKIPTSRAVFMVNIASGLISWAKMRDRPSKRPPTSPSHSSKLYVWRSITTFSLYYSSHTELSL